MTPSLLWLLAGAALCAAEVMIGPGIGLFFAGLAAICVGALVEAGALGAEDLVLQFGVFFALTVVWAALLWKPLKRFYTHKNRPSQQFNNIVGEKAVVAGAGLARGKAGTVSWSGTTMQAELAADAADAIPAGERVAIVEVRGATLIVK